MDTTNTLWLDSLINDLDREARNRRNSPQGYWDGYISPFSQSPGTDEGAWDDIRRRERMAEACYDL